MTAQALARRWTPRSIRTKLAVPFVLVIGLIALFVYLYFPGAMETREVAGLQARGLSIAEVTAFGLQAAVHFGDVGDMREGVQGSFAVTEVVSVRVTAADGTVLVDATPADAGNRVIWEKSPLPLLEASAPVFDPDGIRIGQVTVFLSQDQLRAEVESLRTTVEVVSAFIFLLGVLTLMGVGRLITRPLFEILETAQHIAAGDWSRRAPRTSEDEIGQLAGSFNLMVDHIHSAQKELELMNQELEVRVEERTRHWRRAEEEKSQLERFYGQVLDALPLQVGVFDVEGRYLYLNPAAAEDYRSREEMVGRRPEMKDLLREVDGEVLSRRMRAISEAVEAGCLVSLEERYEEEGQERYFLRVITPMFSETGEVAKVVGYGVDITNRRNAEEALRVSEEKLRQSQKMEAVGRLAGGIAHDFNNLLTVITGHTELLLFDKDPDDPDVPELDQMKRAAERAATLTRQLLAFSRRQVLQPRVLDLNEVVTDVEKMLRRLIGEHIDLVTVLRPTSSVRADPGQVEQVLMNLAVNARDAMPQGGTLTIETASLTHVEAFDAWGDGVEKGRYVMLSVRDSGVGISESDRERIFEPFFTTKEIGKGTGLGLATVYGIVKQSDGFIYLDSRVGLGSVFRIYLPEAADAPVRAFSVPGSSAPAFPGGRETILLVEDEPLVRDLTLRVLERGGYDVLVASGGHEALGVIRNHHGPLHLLLTDIVMPGLTGNELAERVRNILPETRILYMSGYTDNALMDRGAFEDGIVLLQKPFTPERLLQVVHRALARDPGVPALVEEA